MLSARYRRLIRKEMIDASGHMNVGFYPLIFEEAAVEFTDALGLGTDYQNRTGHALFVTEMHLTFEREVLAGETVEIEWRVVGVGRKAFHVIYLMRLAGGDIIHATNETLYLHMELASRKAAVLPAAEKSRLLTLQDDAASLGIPAQVGRRIVLRP